MLLWLGENYEHVDRDALNNRTSQPLSHDNLFHTVLGLFEIRSSVYDSAQDIVVHRD
jgi:lipid A ethanolaminephosphotransferase